MTDTKYNGWTNYETWNVKLWMDNDEWSCRFWEETAKDAYDHAAAEKHWTREERAVSDLAGTLKAKYEDDMPEVEGMYADLLNAALSEVNWHEIAENLMEDVEKEEAV